MRKMAFINRLSGEFIIQLSSNLLLCCPVIGLEPDALASGEWSVGGGKFGQT
jgi:hypothetical protein